MNKPTKLVVASLIVCLVAISVGSVAAMNGNQNVDLDQVQLKEHLQDGSCLEAEIICEQQQEMTQEQAKEQLQEQLQDGSCCGTETGTEPLQEQIQEQLQEQTREQLQDGSCGEGEGLEDPVQERTQERSQIREQFRYGYTG